MCVCAQHSMWKPECNFQESVLCFLLRGIHGFSAGHQAWATNAFMCRTTLDPRESNFSSISFRSVCSKSPITGHCYCRISQFRMSHVAFVFFFMFIRQLHWCLSGVILLLFKKISCILSAERVLEGVEIQQSVPQASSSGWLYRLDIILWVERWVWEWSQLESPTVLVHQLINGNSPCGFHNDWRINNQGQYRV